MDTSTITKEVENLIKALDNLDSYEKDYAVTVNNIHKLNQIKIGNDDLELKKQKNEFDMRIREGELNLSKKKFKSDIEQKNLDRALEAERIRNQHEERMAEIKVNQLKAENERISLEQNQIKSDREFKSNRRKDWLQFGGKMTMLALIVISNILMHKDEISFEREENGIVPRRCSTYNALVGKAAEMVMR